MWVLENKVINVAHYSYIYILYSKILATGGFCLDLSKQNDLTHIRALAPTYFNI